MTHLFRPLFAALLWVALACIHCGPQTSTPAGPIRVGVMATLSGPNKIDITEALTWSLENINIAGGAANRPIELVYADLAKESLQDAAAHFMDDPSIVAVIGPDSSSDMLAIAGKFTDGVVRKVLISPSASSADIFRIYGGRQFIWRTIESDISQVEATVVHAAAKGVGSAALITSYHVLDPINKKDSYGTFFDWFGFFAKELKLRVTSVESIDSGSACEAAVKKAIALKPDVLFVAPATVNDAICIATEAKRIWPAIRLFFSDTARIDALPEKLGALADGIEGTSFSPDPLSGFSVAYELRYDRPPPQFAANAYDALALVAYGLERSGGRGGVSLARAMGEVARGHGTPTGWDRQGMADALRLIGSGQLPNLNGATGPLEYDQEDLTEFTESTYAIWRIEAGRFVTYDHYSSRGSLRANATLSALSTFASEARSPEVRDIESQATGEAPKYHYRPAPRTGMWALIASLSSGWENYRHHADALAKYRLLRSNGVPADRIILITADDIATHPDNPDRNVIRNVTNGPNVLEGAEIEYPVSGLTAKAFFDILSGRATPQYPRVLHSGPGDDVFVFLVGHANPQGIEIGRIDPKAPPRRERELAAKEFQKTVREMRAENKFRRMLIVLEGCQIGGIGAGFDVPGVLALAGATEFESSFGFNRDPKTKIWQADQFAYAFDLLAQTHRTDTLAEFYKLLYRQVAGSHVTAYNSRLFGNMYKIRLEDFIAP